jgi:uncharacterized protein
MLFKRRNKMELGERFRIWFWPRRSFWRSAKYFSKRVLRLRATPHAIAAGVASGVFISFLPIPGFHILLAALVAWLFAGNVVASALGTAFGNPLTFPVIWGATYELGHFILNGRSTGSMSPPRLGALLRSLDFSQLWDPLLKPMTIGAIPLGFIFAVGGYFLTRWMVATFHARRLAKLAARSSVAASDARSRLHATS